MANGIKYLAFNTNEKRRVRLGGGAIARFEKLELQRGDTIDFRILLYKDFFNYYTQTGATWALRLREKRQSTSDICVALDATFLDASWLSAEGIKRIVVKDQEGVFNEGDKIYGFKSGAIGYVLGYSFDVGVLIIQNESGTFVDGELIKVVNAGGGYSGVQGRCGGTPVALAGAKISGLLHCTMSLEDADLNSFLLDKEYGNFILELEETISAVVKIMGQCDVRVNNSFDL